MLSHLKKKLMKRSPTQHAMGIIHNVIVHPLEFITYFHKNTEWLWDDMHHVTAMAAGYKKSDPCPHCGKMPYSDKISSPVVEVVSG